MFKTSLCFIVLKNGKFFHVNEVFFAGPQCVNQSPFDSAERTPGKSKFEDVMEYFRRT